MEHTNKMKKQEKIQLAMVIGIYLSIIILIIAIIVVVKNADAIKSDPIIYGIQKHNYLACSCHDNQGNSFDFNSEGYISKKEHGWELNLPPIK